jgi:hypothetical protein
LDEFVLTAAITVGGVSAAISKTAAAPIERVKLLIQNQVSFKSRSPMQRCLEVVEWGC